ncbi:Uncharacterised protein [Chryseobacterium taklimakanense]|uniref:Uncharacterized protein n=1 Tax=Chryseobacterium taklimakanense TaxID=536441 RepID=A0A239X5D2_9FLAO|nr:Uncharacterised protein [Chryseobacterium taklimakanense]
MKNTYYENSKNCVLKGDMNYFIAEEFILKYFIRC